MTTERNIFAFQLRYQVRSGRGVAVGPAAMKSLTLAFERARGNISQSGRWIGRHVIAALEQFEQRQFKAQGLGPNRGRWAPLTDDYAKRKRAQYGNQPILVRTGALRASLTSGESADALRVATPERISFGSRIQHGHYHQLGTVRMVDRPLFDFDAHFERKLRAAVLRGVRDALRDAKVEADLLEDRIRKEGGGE